MLALRKKKDTLNGTWWSRMRIGRGGQAFSIHMVYLRPAGKTPWHCREQLQEIMALVVVIMKFARQCQDEAIPGSRCMQPFLLVGRKVMIGFQLRYAGKDVFYTPAQSYPIVWDEPQDRRHKKSKFDIRTYCILRSRDLEYDTKKVASRFQRESLPYFHIFKTAREALDAIQPMAPQNLNMPPPSSNPIKKKSPINARRKLKRNSRTVEDDDEDLPDIEGSILPVPARSIFSNFNAIYATSSNSRSKSGYSITRRIGDEKEYSKNGKNRGTVNPLSKTKKSVNSKSAGVRESSPHHWFSSIEPADAALPKTKAQKKYYSPSLSNKHSHSQASQTSARRKRNSLSTAQAQHAKQVQSHANREIRELDPLPPSLTPLNAEVVSNPGHEDIDETMEMPVLMSQVSAFTEAEYEEEDDSTWDTESLYGRRNSSIKMSTTFETVCSGNPSCDCKDCCLNRVERSVVETRNEFRKDSINPNEWFTFENIDTIAEEPASSKTKFTKKVSRKMMKKPSVQSISGPPVTPKHYYEKASLTSRKRLNAAEKSTHELQKDPETLSSGLGFVVQLTTGAKSVEEVHRTLGMPEKKVAEQDTYFPSPRPVRSPSPDIVDLGVHDDSNREANYKYKVTKRVNKKTLNSRRRSTYKPLVVIKQEKVDEDLAVHDSDEDSLSTNTFKPHMSDVGIENFAELCRRSRNNKPTTYVPQGDEYDLPLSQLCHLHQDPDYGDKYRIYAKNLKNVRILTNDNLTEYFHHFLPNLQAITHGDQPCERREIFCGFVPDWKRRLNNKAVYMAFSQSQHEHMLELLNSVFLPQVQPGSDAKYRMDCADFVSHVLLSELAIMVYALVNEISNETAESQMLRQADGVMLDDNSVDQSDDDES